MHAWDNPPDRDPTLPPDSDDDGESPPTRPETDPEAQRAPGADEESPDGSPPMQAGAENVLDAPGIAREPVGNDNIRDGTVKGVMGPPHGAGGQGQGG